MYKLQRVRTNHLAILPCETCKHGARAEAKNAREKYAILLCKLHLLDADDSGEEARNAAASIREEMTAYGDLLDGPVIEEMHRMSAAIRRVLCGHPRREVTRLITYRGSERLITELLGKSMPDGITPAQDDVPEIEVKTLEDSSGILTGTTNPLVDLLRRLCDVERERDAARLALRDADPARLFDIVAIEHQRDRAQVLALRRGKELEELDDKVRALETTAQQLTDRLQHQDTELEALRSEKARLLREVSDLRVAAALQ